jgi:hypothetical protein
MARGLTVSEHNVARTLGIALKLIALATVLFLLYALAGQVVGGLPPSAPGEPAATLATRLFAVCSLDAVVLAYLILRSNSTGWPLMGTVIIFFFGTGTCMPQIETAVFVTQLPRGVLPRLFLMGALIAVPFSVIAVVVLGKRARAAPYTGVPALLPARAWAWRLAVLVVIYLVLYFTFGYYVAWKDPAVRAYYGGVDPGSFIGQLRAVARDTPWLFPLQALRALLWTVIALPAVRALAGSRIETALFVGGAFAILTSAQLLLPNPFMPEAVRMTHLLETASSNFLFGCCMGALLAPRARTTFSPRYRTAVRSGAGN